MYNGAMDEKLPSTSIDFKKLLDTAVELFKEQALISQDDGATLKDIELRRAKASSFLDALNNSLEVSHMAEIISARDKEFKRHQELAVMNPMLNSYELAANLCQKSMGYLVNRLNNAYENFDNLDMKEVNQLQAAYDNAISNMNTLVAGFSKLVTMQRQTGGLRLGARDTGSASSIAYVKGLEESGAVKEKPRVLSAEEVKALTSGNGE